MSIKLNIKFASRKPEASFRGPKGYVSPNRLRSFVLAAIQRNLRLFQRPD